MNPQQIQEFLERFFGRALSKKALKNLGESGPVKEGMTRMFRGESLPGSNPVRGEMFTKDLPTAARFAQNTRDPMVNMVDVPEVAAQHGSLPGRGVTKMSGSGGGRGASEKAAQDASYIVPKYALTKKQIFPILAALASGAMGEDEAIAAISPESGPRPFHSTEMIPLSRSPREFGEVANRPQAPLSKPGSGYQGLREQLGVRTSQEGNSRLTNLGADIGEILGMGYSGAVGDVDLGLDDTPVYAPIEDVIKYGEVPTPKKLYGAAALAKGEGALSKASEEAANAAEATLSQSITGRGLPRRSPAQKIISPTEARPAGARLAAEDEAARVLRQNLPPEPPPTAPKIGAQRPGVSISDQEFLKNLRANPPKGPEPDYAAMEAERLRRRPAPPKVVKPKSERTEAEQLSDMEADRQRRMPSAPKISTRQTEEERLAKMEEARRARMPSPPRYTPPPQTHSMTDPNEILRLMRKIGVKRGAEGIGTVLALYELWKHGRGSSIGR